jgi:glycosyltransferase involved in cell wall biosynthesis
MHLIALELKKKLNINWIADFRDPWTNIDFYPKLKLTKWADKKHHRLEHIVLKAADEVVTVSWNWASDFKAICNREIRVITNGFDGEDFKEIAGKQPLDDKFSIVHIGAMNADRNPTLLWKVLGDLVKDDPDFREDLQIKLIGSNDFTVNQSIESNQLQACVKQIKYLVHAKVLGQICSARVLLLALNNTPNVSGIIPGKLYEYLASRRPVLCVGPGDGDSAKIVKETKSGVVVGFNDADQMKATILKFYEDFKKNKVTTKSSGYEKYSRRELTKQMAKLLDNLTGID